MKMTKKILVAALAVATLGLTSCIGGFGVDGDKIIKGTMSNSHVEYTNETKDSFRYISSTRTARKDVTVLVTNENAKDGANVMGVAWDQTENKDGTKNFFCTGVRYNAGKAEYYISFYGNIKPEDMDKKNFGAIKYDATQQKYVDNTITSRSQVQEGVPYEFPITIDASNSNYNAFSNASKFYDDPYLSVVINIKALEDGKYKVSYYPVNTDDEGDAYTDLEYYKGLTNKDAPEAIDAVVSKDISAEYSGAYEEGGKWYNVNGEKMKNASTGVIEEYLGWYVNVVANNTLVGTWEALDISGEPIEE